MLINGQQPKPLTAHIPKRTFRQRGYVRLGDEKIIPLFQGVGCRKQGGVHPGFFHDLLTENNRILAPALHHKV